MDWQDLRSPILCCCALPGAEYSETEPHLGKYLPLTLLEASLVGVNHTEAELKNRKIKQNGGGAIGGEHCQRSLDCKPCAVLLETALGTGGVGKMGSREEGPSVAVLGGSIVRKRARHPSVVGLRGPEKQSLKHLEEQGVMSPRAVSLRRSR